MLVKHWMPALAECAHQPTGVHETGAVGLAPLFPRRACGPEVSMHSSHSAQIVIRAGLETDYPFVRVRYRVEELIELALSWRDCVCWITSTLPKVTAATSVWKIVSSRLGNPTTMLMTTQTASAPTIDSATAGWERQLSRACSARLSERRSGFRYCSERVRTFSPKPTSCG
jgi:hypothetical protein